MTTRMRQARNQPASHVAGAACRNAVVVGVPCANRTFGVRLASSAACSPQAGGIAGGPAIFDPNVVTIPPAMIRERMRKRRNQGLLIGIALCGPHQHADVPHAL